MVRMWQDGSCRFRRFRLMSETNQALAAGLGRDAIGKASDGGFGDGETRS
jgi:hypothetical protein